MNMMEARKTTRPDFQLLVSAVLMLVILFGLTTYFRTWIGRKRALLMKVFGFAFIIVLLVGI